MPHNVLVSKIRCNNPNKKNTKLLNKSHLVYIGTRPGVDLSPLENQESDNIGYLKYIDERPRSHGTFGNINVDDIDIVSKKIYQISKHTPIFRGIVSLSEEDAAELGYLEKSKWNDFLHATMPDIAKEFHIPVQSFEWVAAFHMEKNHPHVHYMFWRTDEKVQNPFIHPTRQSKCREIFSAKMFELEREQLILNKTFYRDLIVDFGKSAVKSGMDFLYNDSNQIKSIPDRLTEDNQIRLANHLLHISNILPQTGRINYQFMSPEIKMEIDKVVNDILKIPSIQKEFLNFGEIVDKISDSYSVVDEETGKKKTWNRDNAEYDLKKRLANILLKSAKEVKKAKINDLPKELNDYIDNIEETESIHPILEDTLSETKNPMALYTLEKIYLNPEDSLYNQTKAASYFKAAADQGNQYAQYALGKIYLNPENPLYNQTKAVSYFEAAADQGNQSAQYALGKVYSDELSSSHYNMAKAISYFEKAASQGNAFAQCRLGSIYLWGKGGEKDIKLGKEWLNKAANQGNEYATKILNYYDNIIYARAMSISYKMFINMFNSTNICKQEEKSRLNLTSKKARKDSRKKMELQGYLPEES